MAIPLLVLQTDLHIFAKFLKVCKLSHAKPYLKEHIVIGSVDTIHYVPHPLHVVIVRFARVIVPDGHNKLPSLDFVTFHLNINE